MTKHTRFLLFCGLLGLAVMAAPALAQDFDSSADLPKVGQAAEDTLFAKSIEDLPIMKGLEIVEDKDLVFVFGDKRIAQTTLKGRVDIDKVYYFYNSVLPSLGWKSLTMRLYERDGEQLHLNASSANKEGLTFVHFEVTPIAGKK